MHSPEIELDNGAILTFTTEETNHGDYGTACTYARRLANEHGQRKPRTRR